MPTKCLDEERQDGLSRLWIVGEFLAIVTMLTHRPNRHLVHTGGRKQIGGHTLGHDREREPCQKFVRIVGTRHETVTKKMFESAVIAHKSTSFYLLKQSGQWITIGDWNASYFGAGRP
jgi:hypothetical protein